MKTLLVIVVVQSLNLVVFLWFNRVASIRILALRQQLGVYKRKAKKPRLRNRDRLFWSLLSKIWRDWTSELILVRPETVIRWRKRKFREFWRRKSQGTMALLHGSKQIANFPVPVAESPGAVRIGHPERGHLVEYLAPNSVFNSLPRQRSSPHLGPDDRLVTIDRVLHHASRGAA